MKKIILIIFAIMIVILGTIAYTYKTMESATYQEQKDSLNIEQYQNKDLTAYDISTIMNTIHEVNKQNGVEFDDDGFTNSQDAIKLFIQFKDDIELVDSESIYMDGIDRFTFYYEGENFKITQVEKVNTRISAINVVQL